MRLPTPPHLYTDPGAPPLLRTGPGPRPWAQFINWAQVRKVGLALAGLGNVTIPLIELVEIAIDQRGLVCGMLPFR